MEKVSKTYINFASVLDSKTREQNLMTSGMPFIYPHLASTPDAHLGLGAAVGSVIPTIGAIIPAAVGVDIGCGMIAVRTQFTHGDLGTLDRTTLRRAIERSIPLSAGNNNTSIEATAAPRIAQLSDDADRAGLDPAAT